MCIAVPEKRGKQYRAVLIVFDVLRNFHLAYRALGNAAVVPFQVLGVPAMGGLPQAVLFSLLSQLHFGHLWPLQYLHSHSASQVKHSLLGR